MGGIGMLCRIMVRVDMIVGEGGVMNADFGVGVGARAAQVVPHVHFHIIPRVGDVPEVKARSWTVFGKGQREDLEEGEGRELAGRIRGGVGREVERVRGREGEEGVRLLMGEDGWLRSKL